MNKTNRVGANTPTSDLNVFISIRKKPQLVSMQPTERETRTFHDLNLAKLPSGYRSAELMVVRIAGDSLTNAGLPPNHMAVIAKGHRVQSGDLAQCLVSGISGKSVLRYLFFGPGGWVRLQSANRDDYPDMILRPSEVEIVGPVIYSEPCAPQLRFCFPREDVK